MSIVPIYSRPICFRMKGSFQHGHARVPPVIQVEADYEDCVLTVNIQKYPGTVWIFIYDANGNIVDSTVSDIVVDKTLTLDVHGFKKGQYAVRVTLDNSTYDGAFEVLY